MLEHQPDAGHVLATLDARLTNPPYLLVAHHAPTEAGIIHRYRHHAPVLASIDLLDTVRMARLVLPNLPAHNLDTLITHLAVPRPALRHRAMPDVEATISVFERLIAFAARDRRLSTLAALATACGRTARANQPEQARLI